VGVLQLPSTEQAAVASTGFSSIEHLKENFALIDPAMFSAAVERDGFFSRAGKATRIASRKGVLNGNLSARLNRGKTVGNAQAIRIAPSITEEPAEDRKQFDRLLAKCYKTRLPSSLAARHPRVVQGW